MKKKSLVQLIRLSTVLSLSLCSISWAAGPLNLSTEKTKISEDSSAVDCETSEIQPWSFENDKPIESPCKLTRTAPPLELGPKLLGLGKIEKGIRLPTGAIWQPSLYLLGNFRTSLNHINPDSQESLTEVAFRADVFLNLQLSATERVVVGFTPLQERGQFTRYEFEPDSDWEENINTDINTLWFEGDFGELFPRLKNSQRKRLEFGFSFGRQPIEFQDSIMTNDIIDSFVLVKNNLHMTPHAPSTRMSLLYGWNNIHRSDGIEDKTAKFYGLFTQTDTWKRTFELDLAYLSSQIEQDSFYLGLSSTQRIGHWSNTIRVNSSFASGEETDNSKDGTLVTVQFNRNLPASHDVYYLNLFAGIDQYRQATRDPFRGGVLNTVGISYAAPGIGRVASALDNDADDSFGLATGVQWFFSNERANLIVELAHKDNDFNDQSALSLRFQRALGQRWQLQIDSFVSDHSILGNNTGIRTEMRMNF
jgi:hypothetical protein